MLLTFGSSVPFHFYELSFTGLTDGSSIPDETDLIKLTETQSKSGTSRGSGGRSPQVPCVSAVSEQRSCELCEADVVRRALGKACDQIGSVKWWGLFGEARTALRGRRAEIHHRFIVG